MSLKLTITIGSDQIPQTELFEIARKYVNRFADEMEKELAEHHKKADVRIEDASIEVP